MFRTRLGGHQPASPGLRTWTSLTPPIEIVGRSWRKLRREGVRALLRLAGGQLIRWIYFRESHVWYRLDVTSQGRTFQLPGGVKTSRATDADVDRVGELGQNVRVARRYRAAGHDLWLTLEADAVLFACWIFIGETPVLAAPGGWLDLPPRTVCMEDSLTSPRARGRGIAPASWSAIADGLASEGIDSMITKVEIHNHPSRRAVEKAGFEKMGVMRLVRLAGHKRTTIQGMNEGPAQALAERLRARVSQAGSPVRDGRRGPRFARFPRLRP